MVTNITLSVTLQMPLKIQTSRVSNKALLSIVALLRVVYEVVETPARDFFNVTFQRGRIFITCDIRVEDTNVVLEKMITAFVGQ